MTGEVRFSRRLQILLHMLGLSSLGGATFLQALVFADILQHGRFLAQEGNAAILSFETVLAAFAALYFVYVFQSFIRSVR